MKPADNLGQLSDTDVQRLYSVNRDAFDREIQVLALRPSLHPPHRRRARGTTTPAERGTMARLDENIDITPDGKPGAAPAKESFGAYVRRQVLKSRRQHSRAMAASTASPSSTNARLNGVRRQVARAPPAAASILPGSARRSSHCSRRRRRRSSSAPAHLRRLAGRHARQGSSPTPTAGVLESLPSSSPQHTLEVAHRPSRSAPSDSLRSRPNTPCQLKPRVARPALSFTSSPRKIGAAAVLSRVDETGGYFGSQD